MRYFIFKNRRNGKLVLDTDFSCHPPRQILCHYEHETPLIVTESTLEADIKFRNISTKNTAMAIHKAVLMPVHLPLHSQNHHQF